MTATDGPIRRAIRPLSCLLGCWAAAGAAGAGQAHTAAPPALAQHGGAAPTTYRIINLGAGDLTALPAINASGQVAFSLDNGLGSRAGFYDGTAVQAIGTPGVSTYANALNNAGQVTGFTLNGASPFPNAYVWSKRDGLLELAVRASAVAINNRGRAVGTADQRAFRWSAADGVEYLGTLSNSVSSAAAINDAGLIAGFSNAADGNAHAFAWTRAAGMIDLGTLGGSYSYAVGVGAEGQVAGYSAVSGNTGAHAFIWTRASGMHDLGTAGGLESFVTAMSANAHVAGVINLANGNQHAMSWTRASGMVDLGTLGGPGSRALAVNNQGQIVGAAGTSRGEIDAFAWTAKQGMADLNKRLRGAPAGLRLQEAVAISDNGAIVATSNAGLVLLQPGLCQNAAPAVGPIAAADMVPVGAPFDASVGFSDEDMVNTPSANWSWGDGSGDRAGTVRASKGAGSASATHTYTMPGIYSVTATVVDRAGKSAAVTRKIIAYERAAGVVGGSGWFMSPQGANRTAPMQASKATFSFATPPLTSARARSAMGQLHFNVAGLSLRSENFRPTALRGARGQFEGSGTINGAGDYRFTLSTAAGAAAGGGEPARFSLRIWHIDAATSAQVVDYDNLGAGAGVAGAPIVEGRIALEE